MTSLQLHPGFFDPNTAAGRAALAALSPKGLTSVEHSFESSLWRFLQKPLEAGLSLFGAAAAGAMLTSLLQPASLGMGIPLLSFTALGLTGFIAQQVFLQRWNALFRSLRPLTAEDEGLLQEMAALIERCPQARAYKDQVLHESKRPFLELDHAAMTQLAIAAHIRGANKGA